MGGTSVKKKPKKVHKPAAPAPAQIAPPAPVVNTAISSLNTVQNIADLATVIMSEASVGNNTERTCVGFTVINRMIRNGKTSVKDVWRAYAHNQSATEAIKTLAGELLKGGVADPSGGCTHYYSPRGMPGETADATKLKGYDTGGGLETVPGHGKTYKPSWAAAANFTYVAVPDVREWYFKFFRVAGTGAVS